MCSKGTVDPRVRKTGNPAHLKPEDVQLIECLKRERPSVRYSTIKYEIERYVLVDGGTSVGAIRRTTRSQYSLMSSGHGRSSQSSPLISLVTQM